MRKLCGLMVLVISLVGASSASAATEFGDSCTANNATNTAVTYFEISSTGNPLPNKAPVGGVITKWKSNLTAMVEFSVPQTFKVLRQAGNTVQIIGDDSESIPPGGGVFDTRIPVQAGDWIGLFGAEPIGALFCDKPGLPGVFGGFEGNPPPGSTVPFSEVPDEAGIPAVAVIEPDVDNDGFGDETQDKCPQSAAQQTPCPVLILDAVKLFAGKGSVRILVASDNLASITVSASAKVPKANGKGTTLTKLSPIVQLVTPGKIATYTLNFNKALKDALKALPRKKSISLNVLASGSATGGAIASDKLNIKLKGQAKPKKKK